MNKRLNSRWKPDFWFFTKLFVILAMCLFIVYPFYTIITKSVFSSKVEGITLYNFKRFFTKPYKRTNFISYKLQNATKGHKKSIGLVKPML